jgi:phage FluMu gp28-like protein
MDIISTHRGTATSSTSSSTKSNIKGNPKQFSLHTVTIHDAVEQGLLEKLKPKWRQANPDDDRLNWSDDDFLQSLRDGCPDEETWQQEFLCQPGDDKPPSSATTSSPPASTHPAKRGKWSFARRQRALRKAILPSTSALTSAASTTSP